MTKTETHEETEVSEQLTDKHSIILFDDDVNTFDFVIDTLVELCQHDVIQAEQCATLVHYKGKCDVKSGEYTALEPICNEMLNRGLTAEIH